MLNNLSLNTNILQTNRLYNVNLVGGKKKSGKKDYVRTTISLPRDVWEELRIESIKKRTTLGDLIVKKLLELKELKEKVGMTGENLY